MSFYLDHDDSDECSPSKKSRDADEAWMSSNKSMGTYACHETDDDHDTSEHGESNIKDEIALPLNQVDPWTTLIDNATSKVRERYNDILQTHLIRGHDESDARQKAFTKILPVLPGIGRWLHA